MDGLASPNLLRVVGLVFVTAGLLLLAKVITSHAYLGRSTEDRLELSASRRHVGMWFCLPVLLIGIQLQIAGEFVSTMPTGLMVIAFLALAMWLLAYLLIEDLLAERMVDTRRATEARRRQERAAARPAHNVQSFYRYRSAAAPETPAKVA